MAKNGKNHTLALATYLMLRKKVQIDIQPIFKCDFCLFSFGWMSPNFHCFYHEWGLSLRTSNGSRLFQMTLQIHIIYNIRIIFVMLASKDWSFNQFLAYLWSFLSISAFVSINFCIFAVKQLIIYHGKVKSYKSRSS